MHNPVKGEGIMVKINGKDCPLIFSLDTIAKIEAKYDETIAEVQARMPRVDVVLDLLEASVQGFDGDVRNPETEVPPLLILQQQIQKALHIAYFGTVKADDEAEKEPKKRGE